MKRALLFAVLLAACSDDAGTDPRDVAADVAAPDVTLDVPPLGQDIATPDVPAEDVGPPPTTTLGGPCESDAECEAGYCAETPAGRICTRACTGDCPPGMRCEVIVGGGFEQLCLPAFPRLCRPCVTNADCAPAGLTYGQRCVDFGEAGAFCGGECAGLECPVGFACELRADVNGEETEQCVSVTGQCTCSPDAVADAATTTCYRQTAAGRCDGSRTCTADGLTPCDAATPEAETCDGADQDCDGQTDEGLGEEPCTAESAAGSCAGTRACTDGSWVCSAPEPGPETCDGADNDCDGEADEEGAEGCTPRYADADHDDWGTGAPRCLCAPTGDYTATIGGDCQDEDGSVHPGATEACNGKDDNCAAGADEPGAEGCTTLRLDGDGDGYGALGIESCRCAATGSWADVPGGDCNDGAAAIHPGAPETCNGKDDDCDGAADAPGSDGCTPWLRDADGDGAGVAGDSMCLCAPSSPYTTMVAGDCDDAKAAVKPGQTEVCNGLDDDCDSAIDPPGAVGCTPWLRDEDADGYGVTGDSSCLCAPEPPYTAAVGGDCNDANAAVVPGQIEACNGLDEDCDGETDEAGAIGCTIWYADTDGDGVGSLASSVCACAAQAPYVAIAAGDCDDTDKEVLPGAQEVCNGKDDDCDVAVDEVGSMGCSALYEDGDGDGWGTAKSLCLCAPAGDYSAFQTGDCDDDDPQAAPDRPEQCNGADDDCDGDVDEADAVGCALWYADADGDGFGDLTTGACLCAPSDALTVSIAGDCDDGDPGRAPNQPELCDGVDDDCDVIVDEGCGMPVLGWPTAGADVRRSGQAALEQGPAAGNPKWDISLSAAIVGSAAILPDRTVYATTTSTLARVAPSGELDWEIPLPAPVTGMAGPTARLGGTVLVGATDTLVHVSPAGVVLWGSPVAGAPIEASPIVDAVGRIYVLSRGAAARYDAAGAEVWSTGIADTTSVGHPAITTNGAIVFATADGALHALDPDSGALVWTFASGAPTGTGALALGATGIAYFGTSQGVSAVTLTGGTFASWAVSPAPGGLGVFNTAYQCCIPSDQVMVSTAQATGLFKRSANLATSIYQKAPGSALLTATDYDGDTWVTSTGGSVVRLDVAGAQKWTWKPGAESIVTPPAVGAGVVVVGDSAGVLHGLGD